MVVGVLRLQVYLPENLSLKGKRAILRKIKAQVSNNFNVSVAEVGDYDLWKQAIFGVSQVGNDEAHVTGALQAVVSFINRLGVVELAQDSIEILHYGDG